MKKILLVIFVLTLFGCNTKDKPKKTGLEVQVETLNKIDRKDAKNKNDVYYSMCINLINNTDSVFGYWTSTCGWENNFIFNVGSTGIVWDRICDSNFPVLKKIGPRNKWPHYVTIHFNLDSVKGKEIKIGFILIKEKEGSESMEFYDLLNDKREKEKDVIWSEPFKITK